MREGILWTRIPLAIAAALVLGAPQLALAQEDPGWAVHLRIGAFLPASKISISEGDGTLRMSNSPAFGAGVERRVSERWALRAEVDVAPMTRPTAKATPECEDRSGRGWDCNWDSPPVGPLVLGRVGAVGPYGRFHGFVGLGSRFLAQPTIVCQTIEGVCLFAADEQPRHAGALHASIGSEHTLFGVRVNAEVGNTVSRRRDDSVQHEVSVVLDFPWLGWE